MTVAPSKIDPSRTALLRRAFAAEMSKRFLVLSKSVYSVVVKEDAFGLGPSSPGGRFWGRWRLISSNEDKEKAFKSWFEEETNRIVFEGRMGGFSSPLKSVTIRFLEGAFQKGASRSYREVAGGSPPGPLNVQRLQGFGEPLGSIVETTLGDFRKVSEVLSQDMSNLVLEGLRNSDPPGGLGDRLRNKITSIGEVRSRLIAKTDIVRAHAEGQLFILERLGVRQVGAVVEWDVHSSSVQNATAPSAKVQWVTAGDGKVCPYCASLEGQLFTIAVARGMIPVHPHCRCAWKAVLPRRGRRRA